MQVREDGIRYLPSQVLGLELHLEQGHMRLFDPLAGHYLLTHEQAEMARLQEFEARRREAEARRRAEDLWQAEAEARHREAEARRRAEARLKELEAELARLRGGSAGNGSNGRNGRNGQNGPEGGQSA
jgi:multidrug resistance efflux pump